MGNTNILSHNKIDALLQLSDSVVEVRLRRYMFLLSISDGLTYIRNHSENKVPYTLNILERYNSDEPTTSWALSEILKYKENGTYILLKLFAEKFLVQLGFDSNWIQNPMITAEKDRIDICVKDSKYAIIFENKIKGANYQPNQIARYIHKLNNQFGRHYTKDNIFIVLMPTRYKDDYIQSMADSIWRLPADYNKPKYEQQCVTEHNFCWCDDNMADWKSDWDKTFCNTCIQTFRRDYEHHSIVLQHELSEWLANDCIKILPAKEAILKSFLFQFADFLNLQYGTRDNQKLKSEMEKYLREKLFDPQKANIDNWNEINDKLKEIRKLEEEVGLLLDSISRDVIDDWYNELLPIWGNYGLKHEKRKSFSLNINGIKVGCWDGREEDNHEPYWGFSSSKGFTAKQRKIIESILAEADITDYTPDKNNMWYWKYTCNGAERCNKIYSAAVELGYLLKEE